MAKPGVSFLGPVGTYSFHAAKKCFADQADLLPCSNFDEVFKVLEEGQVDYAVIPLENNTAGLVDAAFELLIESPFMILGEFVLPIVHSLLSIESSLDDIDVLYSLPHPYHQSSKYIRENLAKAQWIQSPSSTQSLRDCLANPKRSAAIGFADSGRDLGLKVMAEGIQDLQDNQTRFVLIAAKKTPLPSFCAGKSQKSTIIFNLEDRPGSLLEILSIFQKHKLNLCHIESKPTRTGEWKYNFIITVEGEKGLSAALTDVEKSCPWYKHLGTYPIITES